MASIATPLYVGGLLTSLALLRRDTGALGPYYVLLALKLSWFGDTGAYFVGRYFGGRKPEDGRIDWSQSAQEIHNLVRAVAPPFPGAFTEGMKILRTRIENNKSFFKKGPYQENSQWFAGCGDNRVLRLLEIQETK